MYSCSAPAAARNIQADPNADTAIAPKARNDLKLVGPPEAPEKYVVTPEPRAQEELAARILQMHAASDAAEDLDANQSSTAQVADDLPNEQEASVVQAPVNADTPSPQEVPDLLRRQTVDDSETDLVAPIEPWPSPRRVRRAAPRAAGNGPSFRTLVVSTIVIVVAGSAAVAFGLKDFLDRDRAAGHQVQTDSIQTEPTIESLIAEDSGSGALSSAVTADGQPSPVQIASAKDQIRKVLTSRSDVVAVQPPEEATGDARQDNLAAEKSQARLVQADTSPTLNSPSIGGGSARRQATVRVDRIVEPRPADAIDEGDLVAEEAGSVISEAAPEGSVASEAAAPAAATAVTVADAASFPNSGRTVGAVNMRQSGDSGSAVVGVIPGNAEVRYSSCGEWWCNVAYDGKSGYISTKFLSQMAEN